MTRPERRGLVDAYVREPLLRRGLRREDAARYVGVSPSQFDEWVRDGVMPKPMKPKPRIVLWDVRDLDHAFEELKVGGPAALAGDWADYQ